MTKTVGFTGTQAGMTRLQMMTVTRLLQTFRPPADGPPAEFWHGNEAHADTEAARIAASQGYVTHAWPGYPSPQGTFESTFTENVMPNLDRNRAIAEGCDVLIATPKQAEMILRSGTWATVRYALTAGKPVFVVKPNGQIDKTGKLTTKGAA